MTTTTTPAATQPIAAPKNGAHPTQPQQPVTPPVQSAPPPDATQAELKSYRERAEKAEQLAQQKTREEIINRRKWEGEKKTFGEKLKAADEYERLKREARVNPKSAAEKLWGEKYLEHLNTTAANGNAPTADSVALELESRDAAWEKKLADQRAEDQRAAQAAEQRAVQARVRHFRGEVMAEVKAKGEEHPLSSQQFKTPEALEAAVFNYIVNRHEQTTQRDPETNEVIRAGQTMTPAEALASLESDLYSIAERAAGNEKYAAKLREKLTPAKPVGTVSPVVKSSQASSQGNQSSQPRRTLSTTDLTGSTPPEPPKYRTDEERRSAALAIGRAMMNKGQ